MHRDSLFFKAKRRPMKNFLTILFLLTGLISNGQSFEPIKKETERILQNRIAQGVYVVRMYVYPVGEDRLVSIDGKLRSEIYYNKQGNKVKSTTYLPNGSTLGNEFEYNEKGLEIKGTIKNGDVVKEVHVYEYDENNNKIKDKAYDRNGFLIADKDIAPKSDGNGSTSHNDKGNVSEKTENKYDSVERTYTSVLLSPSGEMQYQNKYWFNDSGQVIKWSVIDNIQKRYFYTLNVYDSMGNRIEKHQYSMDDQPTEKFISTYDDKNLEIESVWYKPYDTKKQVSKYEYEFY
jgi:hypothetical protein